LAREPRVLQLADVWLRAAEFQVTSIPNQGAGAKMQRIEAARRVFPKVWFNDECIIFAPGPWFVIGAGTSNSA
jgi:hypothetical protein